MIIYYKKWKLVKEIIYFKNLSCFSFIILKEKRYKKYVIAIIEIVNFRINNLLNFIRVRVFFRISLNLIFTSKFIKLFKIFNNNIIISLLLFISIFQFIIYFINNIDFVISTSRLFDIFKIYKKISSNSLALLIKINFAKLYKPRIYKKAITNLYRKIY